MSTESTPTPGDSGGTPNAADKTFSQADVDRIVADRVARVERKYANHAELTTEVERLREQVAGHDTLVKRAEKAESERDSIREEATRDKISRAVTLEAIRANARNPELVASLIPSEAITLEDGQVKGAQSAVKKLAESDAYLFNTGTPSTGGGDGGARPPAPAATGDDMNSLLRRASGIN